MKRLPLIPTIVVVLAMALMVWLGVWQLQRARWKEGLLTTYTANANLPEIALPNVPDARNPPLFRRASGYCLQVTGWEAKAGRNTNGGAGWSHIARCRTGAEGPGLSVDIGWSRDSKNPAWRGGPVEGRLAPDTKHVYRLVAMTPAPGLQPSAPPSLDEIPNNHRAYAVQWFIFAGLAGVIYLLALRRKIPLHTAEDNVAMTDANATNPRIRDRMLTAVDLAATFVLATECALTGVQADFDLFGILVLAFVGSVGGGVIRDLLLGEHPPAPFRDWRYAALAVIATAGVFALSLVRGPVGDLTPPLAIDIFEAVGLALAAVAGARKCLDYNLNGASVVIIATINGCGGGILRDVLSARVPHVLHEDFYATAVLAGAALMVVLVRRYRVCSDLADTAAGLTIFVLRTAALLGDWRLPHLR